MSDNSITQYMTGSTQTGRMWCRWPHTTL